MLSQREAATKRGAGRVMIQRTIKAGKLGLTPNKRIDPAEMIRVFGEPRPATAENLEPRGSTGETAVLQSEIAVLEATVVAQEKHIASLSRVVRLLGDEQPKKRRLWQRK